MDEGAVAARNVVFRNETITLDSGDPYGRPPYDQDPETIMGKMTVSKSAAGTLSWNADYAVSIYDVYDFDPANPAPAQLQLLGVTLKDLDDMVGAGYARPFRTVGTSNVSQAVGFS